MMSIFVLIDAGPDPVSIGIVLAVLLFVIASVILMAVGLILILWYRKGSLRAQDMIRPDDFGALHSIQLNNPNQP
ncbi:MAG: hypothetical protein DMF73_05155 [Acidobacteria bacterium]|nr:MAG: hypothetical protein DMF73_05155 [Acidobacteriota bacterium]